MSYARFSADCNVYVYLDCAGFLLCVCGDAKTLGFRAYRTQDMIDHLREHQSKGHVVPSYVFTGLIDDAAKNDEWIRESHKDCPKNECDYEAVKIKW